MSTAILVDRLESANELEILPRNVLESIASELEIFIVPSGRRMTIEGDIVA
ncbi:MAG: hypothetical protein RLZZ499_3148 [Cyanobacteriota bacterium]|jgi:hypothetical protein